MTQALSGLDPASRALLDLSLRRGMLPEEIAELLGAPVETVADLRDAALAEVAVRVGLTGPDELDRARALLAELPPVGWEAPAPNGTAHANGAVHPVAGQNGALHGPEPLTADEPEPAAASAAAAAEPGPDEGGAAPAGREDPAAEGHGGRRAAIGALLAVAVAGGAVAIATSGNDAPRQVGRPHPVAPTRPPAPTPHPAPRAPTAPAAPARPHPPAARRQRAVALVPTGGQRGPRAAARIVAGGHALRLAVRGLRPPRHGFYELWLYNNVIDSRPVARVKAPRAVLELTIPPDARHYRYLDVSLQRVATSSHSGDSVLRVRLARILRRR